MLVTSADLSFIWGLIHWDRHCQHCNFRHAVNYGFEFYGARRLNGYMGNVQLSTTAKGKMKPPQNKVETDCGENRDLYLLCINTWWIVLSHGQWDSGLKSRSRQADESVLCHSCYFTVHPLTKRAFKHISKGKLKPRSLTSITPIKNSHKQRLSLANW